MLLLQARLPAWKNSSSRVRDNKSGSKLAFYLGMKLENFWEKHKLFVILVTVVWVFFTIVVASIPILNIFVFPVMMLIPLAAFLFMAGREQRGKKPR